MPYILDYKKLNPADVILLSGDAFVSKIIKYKTKSKYSHAMIYVGGNSLVHADSDGVYSKNPQRIIVENMDDYKILRSKNSLNKQQADIITTHARNLSGSLYSVPEASASVLLRKSDTQAMSSNQFCSRLVAQAYRAAGFVVVNNPDYCYPAELETSSFFDEINNCVREAKDIDIEFAATFDPIAENQKRMFEWLNKARTIFTEVNIDIQTPYDVQQALLKYNQFDSEICKHIKESKYLDHYNFDKQVNPHRYDIKLFLDRIPPIDILFEDINRDSTEISRHSASFFACGLNYAQMKLEYHFLHKELYKNLLLLTKERIETIHEFIKRLPPSSLNDVCEYQINFVRNITKT